MKYIEKKQELRKKRDELFNKYAVLFNETMRLAYEHDMNNVFEGIEDDSLENRIDWMTVESQSETLRKMTRLTASLLYVEKPEDKQIVENLQENIEV
ncbi:MAG: hypothetical protein HFE81_04505, partial [Bacilli bacterium]|nr:hypothetical protein [Bacilli bacterium]